MTDRLGRLLLVKLEAARLKGNLPLLGAFHACYVTGMEHSPAS